MTGYGQARGEGLYLILRSSLNGKSLELLFEKIALSQLQDQRRAEGQSIQKKLVDIRMREFVDRLPDII